MEEKIMQIKELLASVTEATAEVLDKIIILLAEAIAEAYLLEESAHICPHCGNANVIKYGTHKGQQRYMCKDCKVTFGARANTPMRWSHSGFSVWKDFIYETLHGETLDYSANKHGFAHSTAFVMRHKLLAALQDLSDANPVKLSGIVELDETYVLDNYKGAHLPEGVKRAPRLSGGKAKKRGLSKEYIAICAGVNRDSEGSMAVGVSRSKPSEDQMEQTFTGHIADGSVVVTDGLVTYKAIKNVAKCAILNAKSAAGKAAGVNLHAVDNFHSFIKGFQKNYHGVATKYLNRYCAMYATVFGHTNDVAFQRGIMTQLHPKGKSNIWHSAAELKQYKLLTV